MEEAYDGKELEKYKKGKWVAYADGKEVKFDKQCKMVLTEYEKEREPEFWRCLNEGKPFNFYEKGVKLIPILPL